MGEHIEMREGGEREGMLSIWICGYGYNASRDILLASCVRVDAKAVDSLYI